jgi:hypothetical protein
MTLIKPVSIGDSQSGGFYFFYWRLSDSFDPLPKKLEKNRKKPPATAA